jgi:hypothetical protein
MSGLDGGAHGDHLVRVHALVRALAEELAHHLLDARHAGLPADQDDDVEVARLQAAVGQRAAARLERALHEGLDQILELLARDADLEVLGAGRVGGDERQVDLGRHRARELVLGLLGLFLEALQGQLVAAQIQAGVVLGEALDEVAHEGVVEVLAAEEGVPGRGADLEHAAHQLEDRDVEGAAAEIVDRDALGALGLQAVGQGRGRGLVDDAQDLEAGDAAGVLGGLALGVVEVRRHRDHGLGRGLAQVVLGGLAHLIEDHRRDLGR